MANNRKVGFSAAVMVVVVLFQFAAPAASAAPTVWTRTTQN